MQVNVLLIDNSGNMGYLSRLLDSDLFNLIYCGNDEVDHGSIDVVIVENKRDEMLASRLYPESRILVATEKGWLISANGCAVSTTGDLESLLTGMISKKASRHIAKQIQDVDRSLLTATATVQNLCAQTRFMASVVGSTQNGKDRSERFRERESNERIHRNLQRSSRTHAINGNGHHVVDEGNQ